MANNDFKARVSTISGGTISNIFRIKGSNKIDPKLYGRFINSILFSALATPFRWWEQLRYGSQIKNLKIEEPPIFIIGHWRSGTTYLHNLLCEDPQMGFVTTYQGVFPELLLGSKWLFKTFMQLAMPEKRAMDNVRLNTDFPQEEEFAIANIHGYSLYNFWYFPSKTREYYQHFVEFDGVSDKVISRWKSGYERMAKKSLINHNTKRFISKNPPHTGRVRVLLEMFPDAKFIHIYRNPVPVFMSTKKLICSTIPSVQLQYTSEKEIEENIFWVYERMMKSYLEDRKLIPKENLVEIQYEEFLKDPLSEVRSIYDHLSIRGFSEVEGKFKQYIAGQKSFKKNKHKLKQSTVDRILTDWKFAMDEWNYTVPDNIEIIPD